MSENTEHGDTETVPTGAAPARQPFPKERYREQLTAEEYDSWGEGARRDMFED